MNNLYNFIICHFFIERLFNELLYGVILFQRYDIVNRSFYGSFYGLISVEKRPEIFYENRCVVAANVTGFIYSCILQPGEY